MRRTYFSSCDGEGVGDFLAGIRDELGGELPRRALFHVYVDTKDRAAAGPALAALAEAVPGAAYVGSSTTANIAGGELARSDGGPGVLVVCDVFDEPSTRFEVMQMRLGYSNQDEVAAALAAAVEERPWVKAVEMHACVGGADVPRFCAALSPVRPDIVFFGGAALCRESLDVTSGFPYVFSSAGELDDCGAAFTLYGGPDFHAQVRMVMGWKPFGLPFAVTRAERSVVYELDGGAAYDVYGEYLHIANDEGFFSSGLTFPLAFDHQGLTIIKAPTTANPDGSLVLTSDVAPGQRECRIAYGDPATILDGVRESALALSEFAPQAVSIYSCCARLLYWGFDYVSRESRPFQSIAPTVGWFTGSEFARHGDDLLQYNVTMVIAALREGPAQPMGQPDVQVDDEEFSRQMELVRSLTAFVGTMAGKLQDAYGKMEVMAKTDGLTGIADRREIESLINGAIEAFAREGAAAGGQDGPAQAPCVIMFDLDDFKVVNDAYGHKAGDDVLKGLGQLLREVVDAAGGTAGRWGGEEFMALLPAATRAEAEAKAEEIRARFAGLSFLASGSHTLSLGVARALPGESADLLCSRADKALYAAKKQGKNCVVVA